MTTLPTHKGKTQYEVQRETLEFATPKWLPIETAPRDMPRAYLVANAKGQVCPLIDDVIHNVAGSPWDWDFGEPITHYMPLPAAPTHEETNHG